MPEELYSKPLAPPDDDFRSSIPDNIDRQPLTNADFRRLIQTPRVSATSEKHGKDDPLSTTAHSFTHRPQKTVDSTAAKIKDTRNSTGDIKKSHPTAVGTTVRPKTEEDELNDILKKYRDRARERRDGEVRESEQELDLIKASGYRAVAPDAKGNLDLAEKRKKVIEESKYLGGDMEHTHLVKGLDYALLQKVRSEILSKEKEEDDLEKVYQARKNERDQVESQVKSPLARSIYNILFKNEPQPKVVNELFAPRRMAYVMEMDDEFSADSDIPTTLIRSKQDCPMDETSTNLSINDMVIQKLTQVLSYLRADNKKKKKGKEKVNEEERTKLAGQNIYDDLGDYDSNLEKSSSLASKNQDRNQTLSSTKNRNYFTKPVENIKQDSKSSNKKETETNRSQNSAQNFNTAEKSINRPINEQNGKAQKHASKGEEIFDSYAECYPGGMECYDAAGDSDDDADFSKMDLGNKKGPIRRWDFETEQEYEDWMSKREAMPKAAFQYGVKMLDGRKTRKLPGPKSEKDEKAKLDRQWAKISKILDKRKQDGDEGGGEPTKKIKH